MKVLFYVQHLLGIGHARRAALISDALVTKGAAVTVAFGGFPVPGIEFAGAHCLQLPPARAADSAFSDVLDDTGQPIDEAWKATRARCLMGIFDDLQPDAVIVETYPFGRRKFRFELEPLLQAARSKAGTLVACSVRDILVAKDDPAKEADMAERARRWFDLVLVHGDPALIAFDATFPYADRIAGLIRYTGYVAPPPPPTATATATDADGGGAGAGEVIVSAGGGAVGDALLRNALAARPLTELADAPWRFLLGPDVPVETREFLQGAAEEGVTVEPARPDYPALLRRCRLSISQAGYNTVMDVLTARCRAVLIPFAGNGESEQTIRARLLAERGAAQLIEESTMTPRSLANGVAAALAHGPEPGPGRPTDIRIDGAEASARLIIEGIQRQ